MLMDRKRPEESPVSDDVTVVQLRWSRAPAGSPFSALCEGSLESGGEVAWTSS
jgi:hypothetical protein